MEFYGFAATGAARAWLRSADLLGRPDQDLVEADVPGPGDRVGDRVADVGGLERRRFGEALADLFPDPLAEVVGQLGFDGAWLDDRRAHPARGELLPERLAEGADAVLGEVVDTRPRAGHPAG